MTTPPVRVHLLPADDEHPNRRALAALHSLEDDLRAVAEAAVRTGGPDHDTGGLEAVAMARTDRRP
jgi:hypothetical protein